MASVVLGPVGSVEGAVLDGFGDVFGFDGWRFFDVGDGARDFQDAVVSAGTESLPGLSPKSVTLLSPLITLSTASRLHSGQSDGVRLGTPVAIGTLSQLLGSGLGAQDGCGSLPGGKIELMFLAKDHVAFDNDLMKLAGWADIGRHLLCGFGERREFRKLRLHREPCREVADLF
jgi:hypothetical protein